MEPLLSSGLPSWITSTCTCSTIVLEVLLVAPAAGLRGRTPQAGCQGLPANPLSVHVPSSTRTLVMGVARDICRDIRL